MKHLYNYWLLVGAVCMLIVSSCKEDKPPEGRSLSEIWPYLTFERPVKEKEEQKVSHRENNPIFMPYERTEGKIDWLDPNIDYLSEDSIVLSQRKVRFPSEGGTRIIKKLNPGYWTIAYIEVDYERERIMSDHGGFDVERQRWTHPAWQKIQIDRYFFSLELTNEPTQMRISLGPNDKKRDRKLTIHVANKWNFIKEIYITQAPFVK